MKRQISVMSDTHTVLKTSVLRDCMISLKGDVVPNSLLDISCFPFNYVWPQGKERLVSLLRLRNRLKNINVFNVLTAHPPGGSESSAGMLKTLACAKWPKPAKRTRDFPATWLNQPLCRSLRAASALRTRTLGSWTFC